MASVDTDTVLNALPDEEPTFIGQLNLWLPKHETWVPQKAAITENFLSYFDTKQHAGTPNGFLLLELCEFAADPDSNDIFTLTRGKQSLKFQAVDASRDEWLRELEAAKKLTIHEKYHIGKELGRGTFSVVKYGTNRVTGQPVAIKVIDKADIEESRDSLLTEIAILKKVRHPHIIRLLQIFETHKHLYLVLEYLAGGELFDEIVSRGFFTERDAAMLTKDITSGIKYLHDNGVVHRDLKPENLLYDKKGKDGKIKITDFGLSKLWTAKRMLQTACGTPGYVAPEVLEGKGYDAAVDMWGIGVILYILLCGFPPFYGDSDQEIYRAIKLAKYDFPSEFWKDISQEAKDLVTGLLAKDPKERMTAEQVLEHKWITQDVERKEDDLLQMRRMLAKRKLKQGIWSVVAAQRFRSRSPRLSAHASGPSPPPSPLSRNSVSSNSANSSFSNPESKTTPSRPRVSSHIATSTPREGHSDTTSPLTSPALTPSAEPSAYGGSRANSAQPLSLPVSPAPNSAYSGASGRSLLHDSSDDVVPTIGLPPALQAKVDAAAARSAATAGASSAAAQLDSGGDLGVDLQRLSLSELERNEKLTGNN